MLREPAHEIGFQSSHVNGDPPHTFEWSTLRVRENKHVALLMFMELEPRGALIGRNRRQMSQSKGASVSGKLLLICLASSELRLFEEEPFFYSITKEKYNRISTLVLRAHSSINIYLLYPEPRKEKETGKRKRRSW